MSEKLGKSINKKVDGMTVHITPVTLNETQRRYPALKAKEDAEYWTGSISCTSFVLVRLSSKPTRIEVIEEALASLKAYECEVTLEDLLDDQ